MTDNSGVGGSRRGAAQFLRGENLWVGGAGNWYMVIGRRGLWMLLDFAGAAIFSFMDWWCPVLFMNKSF